MDDHFRETLRRLPLMEACLLALRHALEPDFLQAVFERHRERSYEQVLTFENMVHLVAEALLEHRGSAHQALQRADEDGVLDVSM